jgi:hypothetical protein
MASLNPQVPAPTRITRRMVSLSQSSGTPGGTPILPSTTARKEAATGPTDVRRAIAGPDFKHIFLIFCSPHDSNSLSGKLTPSGPQQIDEVLRPARMSGGRPGRLVHRQVAAAGWGGYPGPARIPEADNGAGPELTRFCGSDALCVDSRRRHSQRQSRHLARSGRSGARRPQTTDVSGEGWWARLGLNQ